MGSSRRRALLIAVVALVLAIGAWIAATIVPTTRISWTGADGRPGLSVSADLPAATCRKEFSGEFPWVRIRCEPERDGPAEPAEAPAPADARTSPSGLDTAQDAE
jgi:hypothetical protein